MIFSTDKAQLLGLMDQHIQEIIIKEENRASELTNGLKGIHTAENGRIIRFVVLELMNGQMVVVMRVTGETT